ncbi:MAG: polysaccharide deacetylase family protein [Gammaproteobacteria bacterium]|uniref:Poly-beta-1,6-N-acetyl-D-glucosamine N-deacetylase n=1 Tax=Marinobacter litoralis TaxID=187981 RepID=A0A3M2RKX7_9GAMM|nr:polysaccharide deacetylase family protein [Marinobacter litoralis]MBR9870156.1 polysaccharide deacetylase family protein [Gammaproteobacteria bacterium]RMJ06003.1 Poly-beta-1,6-N-acetyl-D-glucosamine N-deacetylase precursor [Marinobacter litoralis]
MINFRKLFALPALSLMMAFSCTAQADLVVLQYHHVADSTPPATSTSRSLFEAQLQMISDLGLKVVPLGPATRQALAGDAPATNQVAITFDDAYESVYNVAAPILDQQKMPYTIFVNTNAVGGQGYMDWAELKRLSSKDWVTIANHSADHGHLARRPGEAEADWHKRANRSLDDAQRILEKQLGTTERLFAYPYGEYDESLEQKLSERGWLGFGQQSGAIGRQSHGTRLPRFPMANAYGQLGSLKDKLLSKAFPVDASRLPDGVVSNNPPSLTLKLEAPLSASRLTCFASGLGRIDFNVSGDTVTVQAPKALNARRFRYNCTHPAGNGSYYWLSQQWLNLDAPED